MIKRRQKTKSLLLWILIIFCSISLPVFAEGNSTLRSGSIIDLREWHFQDDGIYILDGYWELYPKRLIFHEDFLRAENLGDRQLVDIPQYFIKNKKSTNENGKDYGTLRTVIKVPTDQIGNKISIRSTFYYMNIAIFADGQPLSNNDDINKSKKWLKYWNNNYLTTFTPKSEEVELIIHYSKKDYSGSAYGKIMIGLSEQIQQRVIRDLLIDAFIVGAMIVLSIFNLAFFMRHNRRKKTEKLSLYFVLLSILMIIRLMHSGDHYVLYLLPNLPNEIFSKLNYWSYYLLMPTFVLFANEIRKDILSPFVIKFSYYITMILGLVVLITSSRIYTRLLPVIVVYFVIVLIQLGVYLYQSYKLRIRWLQMEVVSAMLMSLIFVLDSLYVLGFYQVHNYFTVGALIFMAYASYNVAKVYASAVDQLENYLVEHDRLSLEIKTLESSYIRNLTEKQSSYEKVICQKDVRLNAMEKVADALDGAMAILDLNLNIVETYGSKAKIQFGETYEGKPFLQYFLGEGTEEGNLFTDIMKVVTKMESQDRIETYLSLLPKRTFKQGRWYALTTTLIKEGDKGLRNFVVLIKDVNKLVTIQQKVLKSENEAMLLKNYSKYKQELQYLTFSVAMFAEKELEGYFSAEKEDDESLMDILSTLERYAVWYKVLGFEKTYNQYRKFIKELEQGSRQGSTPDKNSLIRMIKDSQMNQFDEEDRNFILEYLREDINFDYEGIRGQLHQRQDLLLRMEVMKRYGSVLAELYGKTIEPIKIQGAEVLMPLEKITVLNTAISRVLDSIIVHHIEYYDEREKANKALTGHIGIQVYKDLEKVYIEIKDDGAGININTLKDSLYRLNLLSFKEIVNASDLEILPFVFEKGIYYKEVDNEFYGIGDGLWKVKKAIEAIGGSIAVESSYQNYCKFTIALPLEETIS